MSSLAAARADNYYFPQEWRPEHGSINQFHKSHPLGKRAKADGVLVVRFEMPFNVWCTHCETHIGRGVRFNARKKAVDKYFSTTIYEFRLTCAHCQGEMVVRTDPEQRGYNLVSGIRQKVEGRAHDAEEMDTERVNDPQVALQIREDAFFRIEHEQQDERIARERARGLDALVERQEAQFQDDYASNSALRAKFRQQKKQIKQRLDQGSRLGLAIPLADAHPDDVVAAKATVFQQIPRHLKSRLEDDKVAVRASSSRRSAAKASTSDSSFQHFGDPASSHLHRLKRAKQLKKAIAHTIGNSHLSFGIKMLTLFCLEVGRGKDEFSVDIFPAATVHGLKEMIMAKEATTGAWLTAQAEVAKLADPAQSQEFRNAYLKDDLIMGPRVLIEKYFGTQELADDVHVLVKILDEDVNACNCAMGVTQLLVESEAMAKEIEDIKNWTAGTVHDIPTISAFLKPLGGCSDGKIYWGEEERQVFSLLLATLLENKLKSIVHGSPGIGKSTLLCLAMFYSVLIERKSVLMCRRKNRDYVIFITRHDERFYWFGEMCEESEFHKYYSYLGRAKPGIWLLLDDFIYKDIRSGMATFAALTTSQAVALSSRGCSFVEKFLYPCWTKADIFALVKLIEAFTEKEMERRFIILAGAFKNFADPSMSLSHARINLLRLFPNCLCELFSNVETGMSLVDRIRRTFVNDASQPSYYQHVGEWTQFIDSEYIIWKLAYKFDLNDIWNCAFKIYIHKTAEANLLNFKYAEYPFETNSIYAWLEMQQGEVLQAGTATDYIADVITFRDTEKITYWYPKDNQFRAIDSIFKYVDKSGEGGIAYLKITTATEHSIDSLKVAELSEIFNEKYGTPIFIAICSDQEQCKRFQVAHDDSVIGVGHLCKLFTGFHPCWSDVVIDELTCAYHVPNQEKTESILRLEVYYLS